MATRLRYLPISAVYEGMVLGASLTIPEHGVTDFTLPCGQILTESNIRQMRRRHAEFVCVQEPDERSDAEREAALAELSARFDEIFRDADPAAPAIQGLRAAAWRYRSL